MEHIIIGTAGHIDHGKTALIRALTGRDTDTLKEEKKRGISIDLGFTYFDLPDGSRAGVIDVPGHEKFLSNMLAGVCGMDLVLLVIALDEGIMPQTREHMEILKYLKVKQGILVLTKCDVVDSEWADLMEEEISLELSDTMFANWKRIRVSAMDGIGIESLKALIAASSAQMERTRDTDGRFRLPIDRVMSLKGLGTVVAGTLLEGTIHVGEDLTLYPSEQRTYVKSVQVHGEAAEKAFAGQRCAIRLSNVKKESVKRGFVAAYPDSLRLAERIDVVIHMASDTERILKNQSRVHLHIGTSERVCRVVLLDQNELQKGETAYAQLVLEEALAIRKGDHFVLRFYSPLELIGGGTVLDECADKHKRNQIEVIDYLRNKENNRDEIILLQIIQASKKPIGSDELEHLCKIEKQELDEHLQELERVQACMVFPTKKKKFYWSFAEEDEIWEQIASYLHQHHKAHPYRFGVEKSILKNDTAPKWEINRFDAYILYCIQNGRVEAGEDGNSFHLTDDEPEWNNQLEQEVVRLKQIFQKAGANFVQIEDAASDVISQRRYADVSEFLDAVQLFVKKGKIVKISERFYTTNEIAEEIKEKVRKYFRTNETISFASLRDMLGTSRKTAKPLMAFLDEQKLTAWCGKETERKSYE